jgi:hypothetical protein
MTHLAQQNKYDLAAKIIKLESDLMRYVAVEQSAAAPAPPQTDSRTKAFAKFRNSVGFQFGFFRFSGLSEEKAIDHICNAAQRLVNELTAPAPLTIEQALVELREMFPDCWIRIDRSLRYQPEVNAEPYSLVTISIDKFVDDFECATLDLAMNQVRQRVKEKQNDG